MLRPYVLLAALMVLSMGALQSHAISVGLNTFLRQYMNQTYIDAALFYNQSVGPNNYTIMKLDNGQMVLVNHTSSYRFVVNGTAAYDVLRPWALANFAPSNASLSQLYNYMHGYEVTAARNLSNCLQITGLNQNTTCTAFNGCYPCATVPICRKAMKAYGGPSSAFAYQVGNLSVQYARLNASYNEYYSILKSFNADNAYSSLIALQGSASNVSGNAAKLKTNGLFPPPPGFNPQIQSSCPATPVSTSPWYCQIFDFCTYPNFNATQIYNIQASLTTLLSEPLSNASIEGVAANATGTALSFLAPQERAKLNVTIGMQSNRYNATNFNATKLSQEYYNLTLRSRLAAYQKTFADLKTYNLRLNASQYNATLNAQYANLSAIYKQVYSYYNVVGTLAQQNTAEIVTQELNYRVEPAKLASLAFLQHQINIQLQSGINASSYNGIYAKLLQVKGGIGLQVPPTTGGSLVKSVDGGIINSLLSGSNAPVPAKMAAGALYVLIISAAIVVVILLLVYFLLFRRLHKHGRVHLHQTAKRAWLALFIAIIVIGFGLSYLDYVYAQQANAFLPIGGFLSQMDSNPVAVIAYNGSTAASDPLVAQCTSVLTQTLVGQGKQVSSVTLDNYTCTNTSNSIYTGQNCFDQILSSGTPVIVISEAANSSMVYKGIYGHALYAAGPAVQGASCQLNQIISVT